MTKKLNNWDRLYATIEWLNMTSNSFAMSIGMSRAESLYHIKFGDLDITPDMAERISTHFPEINQAWLLTGAGEMLNLTCGRGKLLPYYDEEIELLMNNIDEHRISGYVSSDNGCDCDIVVRSSCEAMIETKNSVNQLFIKHVSPADIESEKEYIFVFEDSVFWRKARLVDKYTLHLEPLNTEVDGTRTYDITDVVHAWLVVDKKPM